MRRWGHPRVTSDNAEGGSRFAFVVAIDADLCNIIHMSCSRGVMMLKSIVIAVAACFAVQALAEVDLQTIQDVQRCEPISNWAKRTACFDSSSSDAFHDCKSISFAGARKRCHDAIAQDIVDSMKVAERPVETVITVPDNAVTVVRRRLGRPAFTPPPPGAGNREIRRIGTFGRMEPR